MSRLTVVFSAGFLGGSELFNLEFLRRARELGVEIDAIVPSEGTVAEALRSLVRTLQVVELPALSEQSRASTAGFLSTHCPAGCSASAGTHPACSSRWKERPGRYVPSVSAANSPWPSLDGILTGLSVGSCVRSCPRDHLHGCGQWRPAVWMLCSHIQMRPARSLP
jgi:hypothetical protein